MQRGKGTGQPVPQLRLLWPLCSTLGGMDTVLAMGWDTVRWDGLGVAGCYGVSSDDLGRYRGMLRGVWSHGASARVAVGVPRPGSGDANGYM